jgi:hypothetical protein
MVISVWSWLEGIDDSHIRAGDIHHTAPAEIRSVAVYWIIRFRG